MFILNEMSCNSGFQNYAQFRKCRLWFPWLAFLFFGFAGALSPTSSQAAATNYFVRGVVKEVRQDEHQLVIAHEAIPNFMDAMTMPFNVKDVGILANATIDEKVSFQLHVTQT